MERADETPEATLAAILHQGVRAIRNRIDELIEKGEDYAEYIALIVPGGDTPEVRVFNVRIIPRKHYATYIEDTFPKVAQEVRAELPEGHFRIVILFDGLITVRTLRFEDEGPISTTPINSRGGLA
jgi:hypothetical protein